MVNCRCSGPARLELAPAALYHVTGQWNLQTSALATGHWSQHSNEIPRKDHVLLIAPVPLQVVRPVPNLDALVCGCHI